MIFNVLGSQQDINVMLFFKSVRILQQSIQHHLVLGLIKSRHCPVRYFSGSPFEQVAIAFKSVYRSTWRKGKPLYNIPIKSNFTTGPKLLSFVILIIEFMEYISGRTGAFS